MIKTEHQVVYPDWAQFIGAVIVLTCTLCVPGVLIIRLISYHRARKQMREFIALTKQRMHNIRDSCHNGFLKFISWLRRDGSRSWSPNSARDGNGDVPYFSADESDVVSSTDQSEMSDSS